MSIVPIAFCGLKGCGKSEAGLALNRLGYTRFSFGDPMKYMLLSLGVPHSALWGNDEEKNKPQKVLGGKSTRQAMVTLATEWGRNIMHPDIWVMAMQMQLEEQPLVYPTTLVYMDDLRFQNEYDWLRSKDAIIIGIQRGELPPRPEGLHISEQLPYRFEELGIPVIKNDGSIAELQEKVIALTTLPP